jgi:hypothetical protein
MSRPIDDLIDLVRSGMPSVEVEQLRVSHTADDDNVWFFRLPGDPDDVQIDTHPDGRPPFLVESSAVGRARQRG